MILPEDYVRHNVVRLPVTLELMNTDTGNKAPLESVMFGIERAGFTLANVPNLGAYIDFLKEGQIK